ncbi:MAG: hypothetical protein ACOX5G_03035 [Kiritimatiellia bacterium]|jgi:hypothetical protein
MHRYLFVSICWLLGASVAYAGDTNFVAAFNVRWQSKDASNILVFMENQVNSNRNVETLCARGIVAAALQEWGRGATNYLGQAISATETSPLYSTSGKARIVRLIGNVKGCFEALADDTGEASNSQPSWNTSSHAAIFNELGAEVPFLDVLQEISTVE